MRVTNKITGYWAISAKAITADEAKATDFRMAQAKKVKYILNKSSGGWRIVDGKPNAKRD